MTDLTPAPWGDDFIVNQQLPGSQLASSIAVLADGSYVVTWLSEDQDGDDDGVFARRFGVEGNPLGDEFQVNTFTAGIQTEASVAALDDGGFVITWRSVGEDGSGTSVHGRRYDNTGATQGDAFRINTSTSDDQLTASVAGLDGGGFVVTWASRNVAQYEIKGQIYNASGAQLGTQLDLGIAGDRSFLSVPSVAALNGGGFAAVWQGIGAQSARWVIYDANGSQTSAGTISSEFSSQFRTMPTIAGTADGGFMVVWRERWEDVTALFEENRIYLQKFDANGHPVGGANLLQRLADNLVGDVIENPSVTALPDGGAVVAWDQVDLTERDVFIERVGPDGTSEGSALRVTDTAAGVQKFDMTHGGYSLDTLPDGRVVVTWNSSGDTSDVYSRIFELPILDRAPSPVAPETLVVAVSSSVQHANVTALENGGHVVVWARENGDGDGFSILGRGYDEKGDAASLSTRINAQTENSQLYPGVAALKNSSIVATWTSSGQDGDGNGVFGRVFAGDLSSSGQEFRINQETANNQEFASVHAMPNGGFLVTWSSRMQDGDNYGIFARRFDSSGTPLADEFQVNTTTLSSQFYSTAAVFADGWFNIVWSSFDQDGDNYGIYMRQFGGNDTPNGNFDSRVNTQTADSQNHSNAAVLADGTTIITWSSRGQDGDGWGIYGQMIEANGLTRLGSEFRISETSSGDQTYSSITALDDGGFVVVWESENVDGSSRAMVGRRYDADGVALGGQFIINETTAGDQYSNLFYAGRSIDTLDNGDLIIVWIEDGDTVKSRVFELPLETFYDAPGSNVLNGARTNDMLYGLNGDDILNAGRGADTLDGGLGDDILNGGTGFDTASYATAAGGVEAYLTVGMSLGAAGQDTLDKIEHLIGSAFNDRLSGNAMNNTLDGGDGHDVLNGKGGSNTLLGGAGNDRLRGAEGEDKLDGGAGDNILFGLAGEDRLITGDGRDYAYGGRDADVIETHGGDDELRGNLGDDWLYGGDGNDDLRGGGNTDVLFGEAGDDFLFGENGRDDLLGGLGNDSLTGGFGAGVLDGHTDTFYFAENHGFDRVKDFEDGIDRLDVGFLLISDYDTGIAPFVSAANGGADTRINFGDGNVIYLENFALADLDASDFSFF